MDFEELVRGIPHLNVTAMYKLKDALEELYKFAVDNNREDLIRFCTTEPEKFLVGICKYYGRKSREDKSKFYITIFKSNSKENLEKGFIEVNVEIYSKKVIIYDYTVGIMYHNLPLERWSFGFGSGREELEHIPK